MGSSKIIHQTVCVEASVTTTPDAKIGDIEACCVGTPVTEECKIKNNECVCIVRQLLSVRFPITFSVHAEARPTGIICSEPQLSPGSPPVCDQRHPFDPCDCPHPFDPCDEPHPFDPCDGPHPFDLCDGPHPCNPCNHPHPCNPCNHACPFNACNQPHPFNSYNERNQRCPLFKPCRRPLLFILAQRMKRRMFFRRW